MKSQKNLLETLWNNRLMRAEDEAKAFDEALASVPPDLDPASLRALHLVLDDSTEHPEVMWGLIHLLDRFRMEDQVSAFAEALPELAPRAPEWVEILHYRILNDDAYRSYYKSLLPSLPPETQSIIRSALETIAADDASFESKVKEVLS